MDVQVTQTDLLYNWVQDFIFAIGGATSEGLFFFIF